MAEKRRSTQSIILEKVTSLEIAVLGHPKNPLDNGLFGDVKEIKELAKATNSRVTKNEQAIAEIEARCEERHGTNAVLRKFSKKKAAGIGGGTVAVITAIYYIGVALGWWG